jgi:hypothetical protein
MGRDMGRYFIILFLLLFATPAWAITPIARFDVVPYQRIENAGSFKIGVIAFSKPGIANVAFSATGQGYSGGTKNVTGMTLNDRTGTWEYWTTFSGSEFSSNGAVTITATVTDNDSNERNLELAMIAEGASAFTPDTCWADSVSGNNGTCTAGDDGAPCADIATCISKLSDADGGIIYLEEGTYSANTSATTSTEWLTITKSATAAKENVIINTGTLNTTLLKYDSVTLQSRGTNLYVADSDSTYLWTNNTRRIGSGRGIANTNPVDYNNPDKHFSTNDYTYNSDYAYRRAALVRGATISTIGNDVFENGIFVINTVVDNVSNVGTGWHSDAYQVHTTGVPPADNRIIYNYKATDVHYQGIFMRSDAGTATDNAFVNVLIEMREPADQDESGNYAFTAFTAYHNWDHLLLWHVTLLTAHSGFPGTLTNSSIIGSIFHHFNDTGTPVGTPTLPEWANGNDQGNEALYNHFMNVRGETSSDNCTPTTRFTWESWPCPHWYAKRPDSGISRTYTTGEGIIDINHESADFTYPVSGAPIIDVISSPVVPVDLYNVERGSLADVGAVEFNAEPSRSNGLPGSNIAYATSTTISLTTNVNATCKYDTTPGTAYASMANIFGTTGTTSHSDTVSVSPGTNTFYARCTDGVETNSSDYAITFAVLSQTTANVVLGAGSGSITIGAGSGLMTIQAGE